MQRAEVHAPGDCESEATNLHQLVVIPIRRVERIKRLSTVGENIRAIVREEARGHADVLRMARSHAMQQYIEELRMQVYGLLENALVAIRYTLDSETDGKLAHRLLADMGVIQQRV